MNTGLLWYRRDSQTPFDDEVRYVASYYERKYGEKPNAAYVHPDTASGVSKVDGIAIVLAENIQRENIWIGVEAQHTAQVEASGLVLQCQAVGSTPNRANQRGEPDMYEDGSPRKE